jgi:hypothetical protein
MEHTINPASGEEARLELLLRSVEIVSATQFRIGGGPVIEAAAVPALSAPAAGAVADPLAALEGALTTALYVLGYAAVYRGGPASADDLRVTVAPDAAFGARLAAANPTATRWEPGWRVFGMTGTGGVNVQKGESAIAAQPGRYAFVPGAGRMPAVGDVVELLVPRESLGHQPGMYFAFGDTPSSDYDLAAIARLYFNLPPENAPWLLRALGSVLNRHDVPFHMKCSLDPARFDRTDGFVLYVGRRFLPVALRLLAPLADEVERRTRPGIPLFSAPLLRGVGGADDPANGESFGQSRCRLLAGGLLDAWRAGGGADGRRDAVDARFRRAGLDPVAPHLSQGMTDLYHLPTFAEAER